MEAVHSVSIEDQVSGECKEDGAFYKNVCGTYVHGVFDREDVAEAVVRVLGKKKGIDVSQMKEWILQHLKKPSMISWQQN